MKNDNVKALFFDIDGTLVSFKTHQIPQSTVDAIAQAKANGVGVFISTGRPLPIITNLKAIEQYIDGYITTNGALCIVDGKPKRMTIPASWLVRRELACIIPNRCIMMCS